MDLPTNLNSKEILFHLNYMGYKNVTKQQLKNFMEDLKKLIKYENNPRSDVQIHEGPTNVNIRRLFESQNFRTTTQKPAAKGAHNHLQHIDHNRNIGNIDTKQKINLRDGKSENQTTIDTEGKTVNRITPKNISVAMTRNETIELDSNNNINDRKSMNDKENIPISNQQQKPTKGFMRPQTSSKTKKMKKSDPVALYQSYQKDWARFRSNMCESSHSDLRWRIREKMLRNS